MLVDIKSTVLMNEPSIANVDLYFTTGICDLSSNSRDADFIINLMAHALSSFRKTLGLPSVRLEKVNFVNNVNQRVIGVILKDEVLRGYYNPKKFHELQFHINANMCVVSWSNEQRTFKQDYRRATFRQLPIFIPDKLKDDALFFSDQSIFNYLKLNGSMPHESALKLIKDNIGNVLLTIRSNKPIIAPSTATSLHTFLLSYASLTDRVPVNYPKRAIISDEYGHRIVVGLRESTRQETLKNLFPVVKRAFYYAGKIGDYSTLAYSR